MAVVESGKVGVFLQNAKRAILVSDSINVNTEFMNNWFNEFQRGRASVLDDDRPGCSIHRKISNDAVSLLLTVEQKQNRMTAPKVCLDMLKRDSKEFLQGKLFRYTL